MSELMTQFKEIISNPFLELSFDYTELLKGDRSLPNRLAQLVITGGVSGETFQLRYDSVLTDEGKRSEHGKGWDRIFEYVFDENGSYSLNYNCGSCDKGHTITVKASVIYRNHEYHYTVVFKEE